jgi:hypothetical protein
MRRCLRFTSRLAVLMPVTVMAVALALAPGTALATPAAASSALSAPSVAAQATATSQVTVAVPVTLAGAPGCATVRAELARLASAGQTRVSCADPVSAAGLARMAPAATSLCQAARVVRTRHASCGDTALAYQVIQLPSGDVLGTGTIAFAYAESLNAKSRTWYLAAAIELVDATGAVIDDTTATTRISCTGGCTSSAPWVQLLVEDKAFHHTYTIHSAGTATDITNQKPVIEIVNPAATDQAPPATLTSLGPARCDSSSLFKQFGKIIPGCVFKDVAGSYSVYLSGKGEDTVTKNVQTAQKTKSRHFGWYGHGNPLTRAPSSVQALNRKAACGKTNYKKPYSCDEYPFAATYQGAHYFPAQNVTMKVLGTQNSTEGGRRSAMYISERLFYGDPYYVFVEP